MQEDNQLFLSEAESHVHKEQMEIMHKVGKINPFVRWLGVGSGLLMLAIAGLVILLDTGARISGMLGLRGEDCDLDNSHSEVGRESQCPACRKSLSTSQETSSRALIPRSSRCLLSLPSNWRSGVRR